MNRPEDAASRTPATTRRCGPYDNGNRRQLQRHEHHNTVHGCMAMAWATAGLLENLLDTRRTRCLPTRELAPLAAAARELWLALADLERREAGIA